MYYPPSYRWQKNCSNFIVWELIFADCAKKKRKNQILQKFSAPWQLVTVFASFSGHVGTETLGKTFSVAEALNLTIHVVKKMVTVHRGRYSTSITKCILLIIIVCLTVWSLELQIAMFRLLTARLHQVRRLNGYGPLRKQHLTRTMTIETHQSQPTIANYISSGV